MSGRLSYGILSVISIELTLLYSGSLNIGIRAGLPEFVIYLGFHIERSVLRLSGGVDCFGNRVRISGI